MCSTGSGAAKVSSRPPQPAVLLPVFLRPVSLRIDARRPASWIALSMAAVGGWNACVGRMAAGESAGVESAGGPLAVAWLIGTLATVAAIGELPLGLCDGPAAGPRSRRLAWLCGRAAWPLAGIVVASVAAWAGGADSAWPLAAAVLAVVVAAATVHAGRLLPANAADAASLALAGGCGSACAAWWLGDRRSAAAALAVVGIGWAVVALAAAVCAGRGKPLLRTLERGPREAARPGILPAQGPLRRLLVRLSMVSSLAGMVGWLFLDPDRAGLYPLLAAAWFISLAVPRGSLLDGVASASAWGGLFRTAAGGAAGGMLPGSLRRPGPGRFAAESAMSCAAILGWPPLVAAALGGGSSSRGWLFVGMAAALAGAAVLLAAVAMAAAAAGTSGETLQAILLAAVVLAMQIEVPFAAGRRPFSLSGDVPSPSQPFLPDRHSRCPGGKPDVEQTIGSCQTAQGFHSLPAVAAAGRA